MKLTYRRFTEETYNRITTLTFQDDLFPHSLRKIGHDCPPMIHCLGDMSLLAQEANRIAIIGARAASPSASPSGLKKAYELGKQFAEEGNIIVSGLAIGCDKAAHEGCLDAGGQTIAIVASGLNIVHPKENAPLQQQILENGGLILSEQPFGVKANPTRLVARNRLQAALSNTVILAECPQTDYRLHCQTRLSWRNAHSRAEVCTPCVLPANTTNDVLWFHIRNTPRSMQAMNCCLI